MIYVTTPFLPPIKEYEELIKGVWERNWLTNNGPLVNELEISLKKYLNVKHLLFLSNGTIALQIAIKALGLKGEIITTPFSYVATTSSIVWEGCTPVFVDIDKDTFNIDPERIETAITDKTTAILATHTFGNPCDVESIKAIANKHNLFVIYDAAHAFGTTYAGKSIFEFGDISTVSFHATKPYHTIEGGAVFTTDADLLKKMALLRNFGHDGPYKFSDVGINGKNSEFHAAMGIVNLRYIDDILQKRKRLAVWYDAALKGLNVKSIKITKGTTNYNHAYYPVLFGSEEILLESQKTLELNNIYPRRYFYPTLEKMPYIQQGAYDIEVADSISRRILCLPMYHEMTETEVLLIARLLLRVQNYQV